MKDAPSSSLPTLDLAAWEPTKITLHMYLQMAGKIPLALMPRRNHWWNITFLLSPQGLVSHTMPWGDFTFNILFNFLQHRVEIAVSDGRYETIPLHDGLSVAQLYRQLSDILNRLGIRAKISSCPFCLPNENGIKTPFAQQTEYHHYDKEYVERFWKVLSWTGAVFTEFSGRFYGKSSPVHLFWHHMDLAVTRFCGRKAPQLPPDRSISDKDAYSHELISFGFWPGDDKTRNAAYYSYTYPSPPGIDKIPLPGYGKWDNSSGSPMALLSYDDLLKEQDRKAALLGFLEQCYQAGGKLCSWDMDALTVPPLNKL